MIKERKELEKRVRERLGGSFTLSDFFVEEVRIIETVLPPVQEGYRFDARYYWVTTGGSGYSGQILIRRDDKWIGANDGRKYAAIADYIASWGSPFRIARGMVEAYFSQTLSTEGVDAIFGRGGLDNYRLANWWAKP